MKVPSVKSQLESASSPQDNGYTDLVRSIYKIAFFMKVEEVKSFGYN